MRQDQEGVTVSRRRKALLAAAAALTAAALIIGGTALGFALDGDDPTAAPVPATTTTTMPPATTTATAAAAPTATTTTTVPPATTTTTTTEPPATTTTDQARREFETTMCHAWLTTALDDPLREIGRYKDEFADESTTLRESQLLYALINNIFHELWSDWAVEVSARANDSDRANCPSDLLTETAWESWNDAVAEEWGYMKELRAACREVEFVESC